MLGPTPSLGGGKKLNVARCKKSVRVFGVALAAGACARGKEAQGSRGHLKPRKRQQWARGRETAHAQAAGGWGETEEPGAVGQLSGRPQPLCAAVRLFALKGNCCSRTRALGSTRTATAPGRSAGDTVGSVLPRVPCKQITGARNTAGALARKFHLQGCILRKYTESELNFLN